jgi:hypothetical protein
VGVAPAAGYSPLPDGKMGARKLTPFEGELSFSDSSIAFTR